MMACDVGFRFDNRLMEQDLGRFSGLSYAEAEADPAYRADRKARWDWEPDGGGESYRQIAARVADWLDSFQAVCAGEGVEHALVVTHAVTLRLFRACLEQTLPEYPEKIAGNGELWVAKLAADGGPVRIDSVSLGDGPRANRE
jgi:broad specificity phosphatase PhoE